MGKFSSIAATIAVVAIGALFLYKTYGERILDTEKETAAESLKNGVEDQNESVAIELDKIIQAEYTFTEVSSITGSAEVQSTNIVDNAISTALITPQVPKALSGSTFEMDYNGKRSTFRLIGLKGAASLEVLQNYLDSIINLTLEFDNLKQKDNVYQVYVWDGTADLDNIDNMLNMRMIVDKVDTSTFMSPQDSIVETPNNKWATTFIKYQKLAN